MKAFKGWRRLEDTQTLIREPLLGGRRGLFRRRGGSGRGSVTRGRERRRFAVNIEIGGLHFSMIGCD